MFSERWLPVWVVGNKGIVVEFRCCDGGWVSVGREGYKGVSFWFGAPSVGFGASGGRGVVVIWQRVM